MAKKMYTVNNENNTIIIDKNDFLNIPDGEAAEIKKYLQFGFTLVQVEPSKKKKRSIKSETMEAYIKSTGDKKSLAEFKAFKSQAKTLSEHRKAYLEQKNWFKEKYGEDTLQLMLE